MMKSKLLAENIISFRLSLNYVKGMDIMAQPKFKEINTVRVVNLLMPNEKRGNMGATDIKRDPKVGDTGTVVHVHPKIDGLEQAYIVECCDNDGRPFWLADFLEDELEISSINEKI
jgi:hypothetical protein